MPVKPRQSNARVLFLLLLIVGIGSAWYMLRGKVASAAALIEPMLPTQDQPRLPPPVIRTEPIEVLKVDSSPAPVQQEPSPAGRSTQSSPSRPQTTRDTLPPARAADPAEAADLDVTAPSVQGMAAIDSVTLGVERSTRSKVDSAQKARIEIKTPIFRKP